MPKITASHRVSDVETKRMDPKTRASFDAHVLENLAVEVGREALRGGHISYERVRAPGPDMFATDHVATLHVAPPPPKMTRARGEFFTVDEVAQATGMSRERAAETRTRLEEKYRQYLQGQFPPKAPPPPPPRNVWPGPRGWETLSPPATGPTGADVFREIREYAEDLKRKLVPGATGDFVVDVIISKLKQMEGSMLS